MRKLNWKLVPIIVLSALWLIGPRAYGQIPWFGGDVNEGVEDTDTGEVYVISFGNIWLLNDVTPVSFPMSSTKTGGFTAIAIDTHTGTLYAGTRKQGLWCRRRGEFSQVPGFGPGVTIRDIKVSNERGVTTVEVLSVSQVCEFKPDTMKCQSPGSGGPGGQQLRNSSLASTAFFTVVVMDPRTADTIYVGTQSDGIYKTTDDGVTWAQVNTGLGMPLPYIYAFAIGQSDTIYTATSAGVFKTVDAGGSWSSALAIADTEALSILIDPTDSNTVYAGLVRGSVFVSPTDGSILKSTDGGATWSQTGFDFSVERGRVNSMVMGPDDPMTILAATGMGVFLSTDAGLTWSESDNGIKAHDVRAIAASPAGSTIYAASQGIGAYRTVDSGLTWSPINQGIPKGFARNIRSFALNPQDPNTMYLATSYDAFSGGGGILKSTDAGTTWSDLGLTRSFFVVAVDPVTPDTLYAGAANPGRAFKSTDAGASWFAINMGLTDRNVSSLAIDPTSPSTVYAGTFDCCPFRGRVFKSLDGGGAWSDASTGLPGGIVTSLAIDPTTTSTLYAGTLSGGIFKSVDAGESWSPANNGLGTIANLAVNAVVIDPTNPTILYAGTSSNLPNEGGVFKSVDGGDTWTAVNSGLTNQDVRSLILAPNDPNTVYAGTFGSSIFVSRDGGQTWN